jgi:hypothetical protein
MGDGGCALLDIIDGKAGNYEDMSASRDFFRLIKTLSDPLSNGCAAGRVKPDRLYGLSHLVGIGKKVGHVSWESCSPRPFRGSWSA